MTKYLQKFIYICFAFILLSVPLQAARLKDISSVRGVRSNQLIGYGIVVGLKGTGDGKSEFTNKSVLRMLDKMGVKLESSEVASKNVAAVMITSNLPPFSKSGTKLDITVSSLGDATSLAGGTLLQSPLRAADEQVIAVAQGTVTIGAEGKDAHTTVGRVPNGAIVEKDVGSDIQDRKMFRLLLNQPDFLTAARAALTINRELGGLYATAKDSGTIDIITPFSFEGKGVEFLATVESMQVDPDQKAKVVVNEKTGTVIIGENVTLSKVAISHGNLTIKVLENVVNNRAPASAGESTGEAAGPVEKNVRVGLLEPGSSVGDLVQALNKFGVSPKDLISILQSIKAAGALHGDLEIL